ncbi:hypothetical protein PM082_021402 [Marasmius tenuissimus]|nr:hypothetical protein PM082_021402 [Marasmius tenuissimus]
MPSTVYQPDPSIFDYNFASSPPSSEDLEIAPESPVEVSLHSLPAPSFFIESPSTSNYPSKTTSSTRGRTSPSHIPRPRNAFMIFRSEHCSQSKISRSVEHDHRHISRIIGHLWNKLPEDKKEVYRQKAEREKFEHTMKYPNYRFAPGVRERKPVRRKVKRNGSKDLLRCKQVAELLMEGKQGNDLEVALIESSEPLAPVEEESEPKRKRNRVGGTSRDGSPASEAASSSTCTSPSIQGWSTEMGEDTDHVEVGSVFMSPLLPPTETTMEAPWMESLQFSCSQFDSPSPSPPPQQFVPSPSEPSPTFWSNDQNAYSFTPIYDQPGPSLPEHTMPYHPQSFAGEYAHPQYQDQPSAQNMYTYAQCSNAGPVNVAYNAMAAQGPVSSFRGPWYHDELGLQVPICDNIGPLDLGWVNPMFAAGQ